MARQTILVVGVTGFIGAAVACRLHAAGARIVGVSRSAPKSAVPLRHVRLDIARATDPSAWRPHIDGIDAVVYCAGTLQEGPGELLHAVHEAGPPRCGALALRRMSAVSSISRRSVSSAAASDFSRSKRAGDRALMESGLDWVILRPSVVIGRNAFGGAALLRGLAALPILPVPEQAGALQVVHIDDVLETVLFFLQPARRPISPSTWWAPTPGAWRSSSACSGAGWVGGRPMPSGAALACRCSLRLR